MRNGATLAVESKTESRVPTNSPVVREKNVRDFTRDKISINLYVKLIDLFFFKIYSKVITEIFFSLKYIYTHEG